MPALGALPMAPGGPGGPGGPVSMMPPPSSGPVAGHFDPGLDAARKQHDYETLCQIITQWNANRLDLFALSLPNEVRKIRNDLMKTSPARVFIFLSIPLKSLTL